MPERSTPLTNGNTEPEDIIVSTHTNFFFSELFDHVIVTTPTVNMAARIVLMTLTRRVPTILQRNRTAVTAHSGALEIQPIKYYKLGLIRLSLVMIPFLYLGYYLGGEFADVIEQMEWYVPDDDDEDD